MTADHVATIRAMFEAMNRHDIDAIVALLSDDATIDLSDSNAPNSAVLHGGDEAARWWRDWSESWESWHWEMERVTALPSGAVLAVTRIRARGRGSGIEVDARGATLWRIGGGRVAHMKMFQTEADALAAAGVGT